MSFKIVEFLRSNEAFDLKGLVHYSINFAVTLYTTTGKNSETSKTVPQESTGHNVQDLSEVIMFILESMKADSECVTLSDLSQLIEHVCYNVIQQSHMHIYKQGQQRSPDDPLIQSVYKLFAAILQTPYSSVYLGLKSRIQQECLDGIHYYSEEQRLLVNLTTLDHEGRSHHEAVLSIQNTLGILDHLLNSLKPQETDCESKDNNWLEECFQSFLDVLEFSEATTCSHVSGILLPKLLKSSSLKLQERLSIIWRRLLSVHKSCAEKTSRQTSNVYIALCGLSEFYIPIMPLSISSEQTTDLLDSSSSWLLGNNDFWRLLQSGLVHVDPLARKQACFLIKRSFEMASMNNLKIESTPLSSISDISEISSMTEEHTAASRKRSNTSNDVPLFWWSPDSQEDLLAMWGDFFLMYETLDEIQVHVVAPVMPRLSTLIQSASINQSGGKPSLHTSWLTILFSRSFVHETKTVLQWGLMKYLQLDINSCPILQQVGTEFLFDTVLPVLNDENLYGGQSVTSLGSNPPVAMAFKQFMNRCFNNLGAQQTEEAFMQDFLLAIISHQSWSPVSLTFVFDTLTSLPECNAWGPAELQLLREIQFSCITMLSLSYRSVLQCLMIQAILKFLDEERTSLQQVSNLFELFSKDECLRRASPLWTQVCQWFESNRQTQLFGSSGDILAILHSEVATLLTFDPSVSSSATVDLGDIAESSRVACLVLLATDSHYSNMNSFSLPPSHHPSQKPFLQTVLEPLIEVLVSINSHIYLPIIKTDSSLQLLCSILYHLKPTVDNMADECTDDVRKEMIVLLSPCLEEIYSFIARRLLSTEMAQATDTNRVSLYMTVLESICSLLSLNQSSRRHVMSDVIMRGRNRLLECCQLLITQSIQSKEKDAQMSCFHRFVASRLLLWLLQTSSNADSIPLPWDKLLPLVTVEADVETSKANNIDGGDTVVLRKTSSLLLCIRWQCISALLQHDLGVESLSFPGSQPHETILSACVRDLSLVQGPDAVPILQCAKVLVSKVSQDMTSLCLDIIDAAWSSVQDEWKSKAHKFWVLYSAVIELIFQHHFLVAEDTETHAAIDKIISKILTLGEVKPTLISIFIKHLCHQWSCKIDNNENITSTLKAMSNHMKPLLEVCVMGTRISKDTRLQQDISVFLMTLDHLHSVREELSLSVEQRPGHRRVVLINFLLKVATTKSPECCQFTTDFVQGLLKKFLEMKTTTRRGYTMNSQLHRRNCRLWQLLLVLVPYIQKDCTSQLLDDVLTSAVKEKHSSVRHIMIWVAIQLVLLNPSLEEMVWNRVQQIRDTSESNICPLLILVTHLGIVQPDKEHKESFYKRAFPVLLPWGLVQTSSIRHLGQLSAKKLWQDCKKEGLMNILDSFPALQACMEFLHDSNPGIYSQPKLDSHFFLFKVHPVQDYTIQTIFHILPFLSSLVNDELLEPKIFEKDCPSLWRNSTEGPPMMQLYNPPDSQIQEQFVLALSIKTNSGGSILAELTSVDSSNKESNVQKKIIPWQAMTMPGFDDLMSLGQEERSSEDSLVLVASLIDKAPNLGGLCRTSQIFGVSTFAVNNLRVTDDAIFKSVSVTAEKWLPIIEVPVNDLATYLQTMRHQGYTLVGVEQTARSRCLTQYNFPQRTLLLLGHERTGIPVELIQLLDVCVEIPQQGVIRSLNVHVSGALLIWEYTRQRLLAQMTTW